MVICKNCSKEFHVPPNRIRDGRGKYCSKFCLIEDKRKSIQFKKCNICPNSFRYFPSYKKYRRGKFCSAKCQHKFQVGENANNWKGNKASVKVIHLWLYRHYGKADRCENPTCTFKNPSRYEWAKLKGKKYIHKRENFIRLCPSCHRKYDFTPEQGERRSIKMKEVWKKKGKENHPMYGKKHSIETIERLRLVHRTSCKCPQHQKLH